MFTNAPEAQAFEGYQPIRHEIPKVPYNIHAEIVRRQMPDKDISQVDALVALHMRVTGHSPQKIRDALPTHAPTFHRKEGRQKSKKNSHTEGRNWSQYAKRTVAYAFSTARNIALEKYKKYAETKHLRKHNTVYNEHVRYHTLYSE